MKKNLLLIALATFSLIGYGQQTVWDFTTLYPLSSGGTTTIEQGVSNNLGFYVDPNGETPKTSFAVDYSKKAFEAAGTFAGGDLFSRFKLGGGGSSATSETPNLPTKNFVYFNVTGPCKIYVFNRCSSSTPTDGRKLYITDGVNLLASYTPPSASGDAPNVLTADYTGAGGVIYIYGYINAFNLYRIEVSQNVGNTKEISTGVSTVDASKTIKSVELYDALGKKLNKNAKGLVVKKITYEDGTTSGKTVFIKEN